MWSGAVWKSMADYKVQPLLEFAWHELEKFIRDFHVFFRQKVREATKQLLVYRTRAKDMNISEMPLQDSTLGVSILRRSQEKDEHSCEGAGGNSERVCQGQVKASREEVLQQDMTSHTVPQAKEMDPCSHLHRKDGCGDIIINDPNYDMIDDVVSSEVMQVNAFQNQDIPSQKIERKVDRQRAHSESNTEDGYLCPVASISAGPAVNSWTLDGTYLKRSSFQRQSFRRAVTKCRDSESEEFDGTESLRTRRKTWSAPCDVMSFGTKQSLRSKVKPTPVKINLTADDFKETYSRPHVSSNLIIKETNNNQYHVPQPRIVAIRTRDTNSIRSTGKDNPRAQYPAMSSFMPYPPHTLPPGNLGEKVSMVWINSLADGIYCDFQILIGRNHVKHNPHSSAMLNF